MERFSAIFLLALRQDCRSANSSLLCRTIGAFCAVSTPGAPQTQPSIAHEHCTQLADRQQQRKTQRVYFARAHNVPGDSCRSPTRLSYLRRAPRKWQERRAFSAPFSLGVCAIFAHIGIILRLFCSLAATIRQTGSGGSERICKPSCCADKRRSGITQMRQHSRRDLQSGFTFSRFFTRKSFFTCNIFLRNIVRRRFCRLNSTAALCSGEKSSLLSLTKTGLYHAL